MGILVTGAAGFVGSQVVLRLIEQGLADDVIATARPADNAEKCAWFGKVKFVPADLYTGKDLAQKFSAPKTVIHLAWGSIRDYNNLSHIEVDLPNSYAFLKEMAEAGARRFFVAGSCFEYGTAEGAMDIDTPPGRLTTYAFAKRALHGMIDRLFARYPGLTYTWGRIFYMHGEGQHAGAFVASLLAAINNGDAAFNMSEGEQLRDYSPVTEVARKICLLALEQKYSGVYNICSGKPITMRQMAEEIIARHKSNIRLNLGHYPYPSHEPLNYWGVDNVGA